MKIGSLIHFSVIWRSCGSEVVIHELLKAAVDAGHEVTVWVTHKDAAHSWRGHEPDETLDGVKYVRVRNSIIGAQKLKNWRPDVVVSHHQHVGQAIKTAKIIGARSVFLTHNSYDLNRRPLQAGPDLVIHNSQHVADTLSKFGPVKEQMIFHPPLTPERHLVPSTGVSLTLINLNPHKGSRIFYRLAELLPDHKFLGVIGGHGDQIVRRNLPNVEILEHSPEMQRVWARTRTLLMPSLFESYGLTAVEAGINGIPTIANATPGLVENIEGGGSFIDWGKRNLPPIETKEDEKAWLREWDNPSPDHIAEWVEAVKVKDDDYQAASDYARERADRALKETRDTLKQWLDWLAV